MKYDELLETLKQIIKLESSPFNIVLLVDYYFQKSKYDLARKYYEMAIDVEESKPSKY